MLFRVTLKNNKIRSYHLIALLIVFLNLAVFIFLLFSDKYFNDAIASLFLLSIYCLFRYSLARKYKTQFYIDQVAFFILMGCWLALKNFELAAICLLAGILYHFSLQKIQFLFTNDSVKKINFPSVKYSWEEIDNVLLRDNMLTLDFSNNKLIQCEIDENENINEKQFNEFVKGQLLKRKEAEKKVYLN